MDVALITARRDSIRLPFKNRRHVGGFPLWMRPAIFAIRCGLRPVVDTDDEAILAEAEFQGIETHRRLTPPESEGGTHWQAIADACRGLGLDRFILLQPTSPFRSQSVLRACLDAFDGKRPVLTCSTAGKWDGNIGLFCHPTQADWLSCAAWVRNPFAYSLQIDTPADLLEARQAEEWMPGGGLS